MPGVDATPEARVAGSEGPLLRPVYAFLPVSPSSVAMGPEHRLAQRLAASLLPQGTDLSGAVPQEVLRSARAAEAVFLISSDEAASLSLVAGTVEWLRSMNLDDRCGLILWSTPAGASPAQAEALTGLPVCAVIHDQNELGRVVAWLRHESEQPQLDGLGADSPAVLAAHLF